MLKPWWQQWPKRLGYELRQLRYAGISYKLDYESFRNGAGVLFLTIENEGPWKGLSLTARFPDIYPYTRFEIFCNDIVLDHHQHPFAKSLCLIGRASENWRTTDTIAKFLTERLPNVISAGQSPGPGPAASIIEEPQGEPFSDYYTYQEGSIVITNGAIHIPVDVNNGYIDFVFGPQNGVNQFILHRISDEHGKILAENEPEYLQKKLSVSFRGKWIRRDSAVVSNNPDEFWAIIEKENEFLRTTEKAKIRENVYVTMVGIVFPEEYSLRKSQDGWVFLLRVITRQNGKYTGRNHLVRAGYAGRNDLVQRVPFFSILQQKKIAVIGAGCLGGPSVLELARCGLGEIRMLDHDFLDPGTSVRWPFGLVAAGQLKVLQLAKFIYDNYPFTKVVPIAYRLGVTSLATKKELTDIDVLNELLDGVDLIYDATTELGIQHFLSDMASARQIPYVGVSTTHGAWGGIVVKISPENTAGCWNCYRNFITENVDANPAKDDNGIIQPKGCGDVTYVGAGFDAQPVALEGVRSVISMLTSNSHDGYPSLGWDFAVLNLRDQNGYPIPPTWKTYKLQPHPNCRCTPKQK